MRYCLLLLFSFFITADAHAVILIHGNTADTSVACTEFQSETSTTGAGNSSFGDVSATKWRATRFVATSTTTVCEVEIEFRKTGSATFNVVVSIYSDTDAGGGNFEPDALIGTASDSVNGTAIVHLAYHKFENLSASITNTTAYWIVLTADGNNASNYLNWRFNSASTTERLERSSDGITWTNASTSVGGNHRLFGQ